MKRYAVWFPGTGKYITRDSGLAWTTDLDEATEMAGESGQVVDADDFAAHWTKYRNGTRAGSPGGRG